MVRGSREQTTKQKELFVDNRRSSYSFDMKSFDVDDFVDNPIIKGF